MKHATITGRGKITIRILLYWMTFVGIYMTGGFIGSFFPGKSHLPGFSNWISGTLAAFLVTWIFLRWEKSSFTSIGLLWEKGTLFRFFKGFLLGSCIFFVMVLILAGYSGGRLQRIPWNADGYTLIAYLTFIPLGLMEEVAFRSYPLVRLNQVFGIRVTLLIIALAFALYHISMGWSIYVALAGPFVWSFVFGLAAVWSRGIALPAGIHISVNVLQNIIGLNGGKGLLWKISFPESHLARTELIGLSVQGCLLAASLIAMELFIRRNGKESIYPEKMIRSGLGDK
ncbi:CPBP family intramembrane glutamic endopeptidase [Puia sp. P3]|uniref:CPBP family intramembrane glutamic endopeptidase n=1 Tax=Puia sp. P3 TaxID=3423952 RepID=UPI003D672B01